MTRSSSLQADQKQNDDLLYRRPRPFHVVVLPFCYRVGICILLLTATSSNSNAFSPPQRRLVHVQQSFKAFSPRAWSLRLSNDDSSSSSSRRKQLENAPPSTDSTDSSSSSSQEDSSSSIQHQNDAVMGNNNDAMIGSSSNSSSTATVAAAKPTQYHTTRKDKFVVAASVVASLMFFQKLLRMTGPHGWRYFMAGGVCAAISHAITTPIDVVKTRQQVDADYQQMSIIKCTTKIVRSEGINALLAGLGPTVVGYLLEGGIKFGVYEVLKPAVAKALKALASLGLTQLESTLFGFFVCGSVAGVAASVVLCPMEALRIRMVAEPDFCQGWVEGFTKMLKYEGVTGLWKGVKPMMLKQVPYTVMKNVSFDFFTKWSYMAARVGGYRMTSTMTTAIPLVSAFLASILSCISSQPGDTLLSLVNAHEGNRRMRDFGKDIIKSKQGVGGFFVGVRARFFHVGTIVTMQLLLYDFIKRLCGIAPTGSV